MPEICAICNQPFAPDDKRMEFACESGKYVTHRPCVSDLVAGAAQGAAEERARPAVTPKQRRKALEKRLSLLDRMRARTVAELAKIVVGKGQ